MSELPEGPTPALSAEDLEHFRSLLVDRRQRIRSTVSGLEDRAFAAGEEDASVDHMADRGSETFDQDLAIGLVESEREELRLIERALAKIDGELDGAYGVCEGTGEPIGRRRLEAIPWARYSIEYQRRIEKGEVEPDEPGGSASGGRA